MQYSIYSSAALLSYADLHSSPSSSCSSLARSNQPSPAVDVVHLLCRDPGPRLVIRGNGHSILPACKVHAHRHIRTNKFPLFHYCLETRTYGLDFTMWVYYYYCDLSRMSVNKKTHNTIWPFQSRLFESWLQTGWKTDLSWWVANICTLIIHGSVVIHSPLVLPHPTWRTIKLSRVTALLSILRNTKLQLSTTAFLN